MAKTTFLKQGPVIRGQKVIGETEDAGKAALAERAVRSVLSEKSGHSRPVYVVRVPRDYADGSAGAIKPGQVFASAVAASIFVGAHFNALTRGFSAARKIGRKTAFVRGIEFAYYTKK